MPTCGMAIATCVRADRAEDTPPDPLPASPATQVQTDRVDGVASTQENTRADASGTLDALSADRIGAPTR
ncbi:hypothetical protein XAB3213_3600001 [Xanthomonas citri pv. bilvae]|nr:hypothetical protein XAB3213_3600001 [Xanthomonas citri pv. bilvae]